MEPSTLPQPVDNNIESLRAAGRRRLDLARAGLGREDVQQQWGRPADLYPFTPGECWLPHVRYLVDDYEAEIGFYIDLLGFSVVAFDDRVAMLRDPERTFYLQVSPAGEFGAVHPETISIEVMVGNPIAAAKDLVERGIVFDKELEPCGVGSPLMYGEFRTPHGVTVSFWGMDQGDQEG